MSRDVITIPVKLDAATFKRFAKFDTLRLRKRAVRPIVFALILAAFAVVAILSKKPQSELIAAVLLLVGVGLPAAYFLSFALTLKSQTEERRLVPARHVYTVTLDFDGVQVINAQIKESPVRMKWQDVRAAFRAKGCIYLYATPERAFLLPDGQADADAGAVWSMIEAHMPGRCKTL